MGNEERFEQRRNDIGYKQTIVIFGAVVSILLGLFANAAWSQANLGNEKASALESRVAVLETYYKSFSNDFQEIKDILKRRIPNG